MRINVERHVITHQGQRMTSLLRVTFDLHQREVGIVIASDVERILLPIVQQERTEIVRAYLGLEPIYDGSRDEFLLLRGVRLAREIGSHAVGFCIAAEPERLGG